MRSTVQTVVLLLSCSAIAACDVLSGLDQIQESDCAPNGCTDASILTGDALPVTLDVAVIEAPPDAPEEPADRDQASPPDARLVQDAGADATLDADAAPASTPDAAPDTDAPVDASDTSDASDASEAGCNGVYFRDPFDSNAKGWTLDPSWTIAQECASPPAPQKGNPDPTTDHTGASSSGVLGAFVCGNNATGKTTPFLYATSPVVDVSGAPTLKLGFWRWLNTDASDWMTSTVDVYDGAKWVNVYTNPSGAGNLVTDASWTYEDVDVTAWKSASFRVRFGYSIPNGSVYAMSAWNVDDLTLAEGSCE